MRKAILWSLLIFQYAPVSAVPVMNENVANSSIITIYPDHLDQNRFYVAPNIVMIALDPNGVPYFSYNEYSTGVFSKAGLIQMTLKPQYTRDEMDLAKKSILADNPTAKFSSLPFIESRIIHTLVLKNLISNSACNHIAGLIEQEQACQLVLSRKGMKMFHRSLSTKTLFMTLDFRYIVEGVIKDGEGHFTSKKITHGVAVRIDGGQLAGFPDLIGKSGSLAVEEFQLKPDFLIFGEDRLNEADIF